MHYLVDGYSLIHAWPPLRQAMGKRLAHARDLLAKELQQYQDQSEDQVSVFFDGRSGTRPRGQGSGIRGKNKKRRESKKALEIVFSSEDQSADTLIEQRIGASRSPSQFVAVTGDFGIQNTVHALGASSISPDMFLEIIRMARKEFAEWLDEHHFRTKRKFNRG